MINLSDAMNLLDAESVRLFGTPCTSGQRDCFLDSARYYEALAMLDDMESRLGFNVDLVRESLIDSFIGDYVGVFKDRHEFALFIWSQTPEDMRADYTNPDEYLDGCLLENNGVFVIRSRADGRVNVFDVG